jgi:hypothetical protein
MLNPYELLPFKLRIKQAGDRLYDKKLTPIQTISSYERNRHKLERFLKCLILNINLARHIYILPLYLTKNNEELDDRLISLYLGDFTYYLPSGMSYQLIANFSTNSHSSEDTLDYHDNQLHVVFYFISNIASFSLKK